MSASTLEGISTPHVFYIVKEMVPGPKPLPGQPEGPLVEGVVMYNRFLAQSHKDSTVCHNPEWKTLPFGPWTARVVLLRLSELPTTSARRTPPRIVDTDNIRACMRRHVIEKEMSQDEYKQFEARVLGFESAASNLAAECPTCSELQTGLASIGPISRLKKDASAEQKTAVKLQTDRKNTLTAKLYTHLTTDPHPSLALPQWWEKWQQRVCQVIRPYYLHRNLISQLTDEQRAAATGRSVHPIRLVSDRGAPPISRLRIDERWEIEHGLPKVGHFVLVRGNPMQPFWIGEVIASNRESEEDREYRPSTSKKSSAGSKKNKSAPPAAAAASSSPTAAAAAAAEPAGRKSTRCKQVRNYREVEHDAMDTSDDLPAEPEPEPAISRGKRKSRLHAAPASKAARIAPASSAAAAAAASSSSAAASSSASAAFEDEWTVRWYDFVETAKTKKDKLNPIEADWNAFMATVGGDELVMWNEAKELAATGDFGRLPPSVVNRWKSVTYAADGNSEVAIVKRGALIVWGKRIFKANMSLLESIFKEVMEDLCETRDLSIGMGIDHRAEALAAAAGQRERNEERKQASNVHG